MKIIRIAQRNIELPANRMPRSNTYYIRSTRLTKTTGGSNKEYVVRIYMYDNVTYSVVCWNGRIDGALTPQPKYYGASLSMAESIASDWVDRKRATGYRGATDNNRAPGTSTRPTNFPALGRPSPTQQSTTPPPPIIDYRIDYGSLPPEIQRFINQMADRNEATLGRYFYRIINDVDSRRGSTWRLEMTLADDHNHIIRIIDRFTNIADAMRQASRWAMDSQGTDRLRTQAPSSSESLPTMEQFVNELAGTGMAMMGSYRYNFSRIQRNGRWGYGVQEHNTGNIEAVRERFLEERQNYDRVSAISTARIWALERRNEQLGQTTGVKQEAPQETPQEDIDAPVKDEEIPPENREILELLGKNKTWYKTAQSPESSTNINAFARELFEYGEARAGNYRYTVTRVERNGRWVYEVVEYKSPHGTDANKVERFIQRESAISKAVDWAMKAFTRTTDISKEDIPVKDEEIPPENREVLELLGKQKEIINRMSFKSNEDWYLNLGESIGDELKGYFKFIIKDNPIGVYNIWWEGLDKDIKITKHDMPIEKFLEYKNDIVKTAKEESLKAYKEAMLSQGGR